MVQQNAAGDLDCSDKMCSLLKNSEACARRKAQVRTYNVPSTEAKGPVFARALASRMVLPESQFCMQIDSHMDFAPGWENHLLEFWASTKNEYAVLSTYVADMRQLGQCVNGQFEVPHLCQVGMQSDSYEGAGAQPWGFNNLANSTYASACYFVASSNMIQTGHQVSGQRAAQQSGQSGSDAHVAAFDHFVGGRPELQQMPLRTEGAQRPQLAVCL